jgi:hypothetical protein
MLIHEDKIKSNKELFITSVKEFSKRLGIDANWLMVAMYIESAGTFNPAIQNKSTNATGLIQFMPSTAKALGTSVDQLKVMDNVQQLSYVYKYLLPYAGKLKSFIDLYFSIFFPLAIQKPLEWILEAKNLSPMAIAVVNKNYDLNKDGKITVGEVETAVLKFVPDTLKEFFKKKV